MYFSLLTHMMCSSDDKFLSLIKDQVKLILNCTGWKQGLEKKFSWSVLYCYMQTHHYLIIGWQSGTFGSLPNRNQWWNTTRKQGKLSHPLRNMRQKQTLQQTHKHLGKEYRSKTRQPEGPKQVNLKVPNKMQDDSSMRCPLHTENYQSSNQWPQGTYILTNLTFDSESISIHLAEVGLTIQVLCTLRNEVNYVKPQPLCLMYRSLF